MSQIHSRGTPSPATQQPGAESSGRQTSVRQLRAGAPSGRLAPDNWFHRGVRLSRERLARLQVACFQIVDKALNTRYASRPASSLPAWGSGTLPGEASSPVTELLVRWRDGDEKALEDLMPLVYAELRRLAQHYLRRERGDHTLQSTALVHEAYLRLVGKNAPQWQSRAHFFGVAAHLMRQILVDYARSNTAAKRGGNACTLTLEQAPDLAQELRRLNVDVIALDGALERLSSLDAQQSRIVELRFFGGLSIEETSEVMDISPATVKRNWTTARAWLHREIDGSGAR